jgi:hypothetical protein
MDRGSSGSSSRSSSNSKRVTRKGSRGSGSSRSKTLSAASKSVTKTVAAVSKFFRGIVKTVIPYQTKIREISDTNFEELKRAFLDIQPRRHSSRGACIVIQSADIKNAEDLIEMYLNAKHNEGKCYNTHKIERFEKTLDRWTM